MMVNQQLDLAYGYIEHTTKNIFLTGKAGTGKTTFLQNLKKNTAKQLIVVAPTGVAAINAGGVTIHSFFNLPFSPFIPATTSLQRKFNKDKINLIKGLNLLVIDEISMVRADTLDAIDHVLRLYKNPTLPFGGVQLLMIGDLHQLSPIIKDYEWQMLQHIYPNIYFFNSLSLQKATPIVIQLKHIYRQNDESFIQLLNNIRENKISRQTLDRLNTRFIPNFKAKKEDGYITLTTHNQVAQNINHQELATLKDKSKYFKASIDGQFEEQNYPTSENLELKINAQVMFIKNDTSREKQYYNGKIGIISRIAEEVIYVKCPDNTEEIAVLPQEWRNIKYELNQETKIIEEKILGSFIQYPLKLAWAITIHKSQGLTFEKAIIDAQSAFAFGQVYVALSRCKSFEGIVLLSPISINNIKNNTTVENFNEYSEKNAPDEYQLFISKIECQQELILSIFDFIALKTKLFYLKKMIEENYKVFIPSLIDDINVIQHLLQDQIINVSNNFHSQLKKFFCIDVLPQSNEELQTRMVKASDYFLQKIEEIFYEPLKKLIIDSDNKKMEEQAFNALENLKKEVFLKISLLKLTKNDFNPSSIISTISNAELNYQQSNFVIKKQDNYPENISNASLYKTLQTWRKEVAEEKNQAPYMILQQKSLLEIIHLLPSNVHELEKIKGIGKNKIKLFGDEILSIVHNYLGQNKHADHSSKPKIKIDTKQVSFDFFKQGKSVKEIAAERNLSVQTIYNHLLYYVKEGQILANELMEVEKLKHIVNFIEEEKIESLTDIKNKLGDMYSYDEIKIAINHVKFISNLST